jgi:hypothetical protein
MDTDGVLRELLNGRVDTVEFSGKPARKKESGGRSNWGQKRARQPGGWMGTCWQKRASQADRRPGRRAGGWAGGWEHWQMPCQANHTWALVCVLQAATCMLMPPAPAASTCPAPSTRCTTATRRCCRQVPRLPCCSQGACVYRLGFTLPAGCVNMGGWRSCAHLLACREAYMQL